MARRDLKSTRNDLVIDENLGDFAISDSDQAHIEHIIDASPSDFKQWPLLGVRAVRFLNAPSGIQSVKRSIITQLESDNYGKISIQVEGSNFEIDATPLT